MKALQAAVLIGDARSWHRNCSDAEDWRTGLVDAAASHGRDSERNNERKLGDDAGTGNDSR